MRSVFLYIQHPQQGTRIEGTCTVEVETMAGKYRMVKQNFPWARIADHQMRITKQRIGYTEIEREGEDWRGPSSVSHSICFFSDSIVVVCSCDAWRANQHSSLLGLNDITTTDHVLCERYVIFIRGFSPIATEGSSSRNVPPFIVLYRPLLFPILRDGMMRASHMVLTIRRA